jgi:energy-coupling factor transporter ATP-binding protein EcfA2
MLGIFGLNSEQHLLKIAELSGGQKARVVFAALAASRPHILLLDEPTNHLDLESVDALVEGIKEFAGGVVLASHDARLIEETECELWVCGRGESGVRRCLSTANLLRLASWQHWYADCAPWNCQVELEPAGLPAYRKAVCRDIDRRAVAAAKTAAGRAEQRKAARAKKLIKYRPK